MSIVGVVLQPGEAGGVSLLGQRIDCLVGEGQAQQCSIFELRVEPGFDVGAHYHTQMEEYFYVLEGEADLRCGDRKVRGGPGTFVFVPKGAPHSYGNPGNTPVRLLLVTSPPGFEKYFAEMADLYAGGTRPDPETIAKLRARYDTIQIATPSTVKK
jgi:mannose-6-phosphate isomerase-like protein (cupin superfamily)